MAGHLAVVLPGGMNDPWTAPVLIPTLALEQRGAAVERIDYGPVVRPDGLEREASADFNAAVARQVVTAIERRRPAAITFVAKSRGTLFLAAMDVDVVPAGCTVEAIWVTPLLGLEYVRTGVVAKAWRSLVVAGSADPYHDVTHHQEVCAAIGAHQLVVEGANHGLVVEGDVLATVDGHRRLAEASLAFVAAAT